MYADGCIHKINKYGEQELSLVLQKEDEEILVHFCQDLESTYPIRYDYSKNNKNKNCSV